MCHMCQMSYPSAKSIEPWIKSKCLVGPLCLAPLSILHDDWVRWAISNGAFVGTKKAFSMAVAESGFVRYSNGKQRMFARIQLRSSREV